jgi:hypothetical protein
MNRGSKKHRPSKRGANLYKAQNAKAQSKALALAAVATGAKAAVTDTMKTRWAKVANWYRKTRFLKGNYTPHQGKQEKARRVRQMAEHKCINPEAWT